MSETAGRPKVLVVADDPKVTSFLEGLLAAQGCQVRTARDGSKALRAVANEPPDVILMDILLPDVDGVEVCRRLKRDASTRLLPIVLLAELNARKQRIDAIDAGADAFLTKPVDMEELLTRVRSLARLKRYTDDLDSAAAIVMTLTEMIESRDGRSEGHCHRMANYATALGRRIGVDEDGLTTLQRGGFLHDIGMLAIPDGVLSKEGPLTPKEFERVKYHTVLGDSLCKKLRSLKSVRPIVRHHHERLDGSGYPDGLRGDAIPLGAQIIAIADTYDAATTERPYQPVKPADEAIAILRYQVQCGWKRRDLIEEFVAVIESGRLETFRVAPAGS